MHTKPVLLLSSLFILPSAFPQGSLTPPGPPAPTMKTLDQVEARIPIDATHTSGEGNNVFVISKPGSYYFTDNINTQTSNGNAILVSAAGVTIDLNGFTLDQPGGNGGIAIEVNANNCTIKNGTIGNGFLAGIVALSQSGGIVSRITVNGGGVTGNGVGIQVADGWLVTDCTVQGHHAAGMGVGVGCTVAHCAVRNCGSQGIFGSGNDTIAYCTVEENKGDGIRSLGGSTVEHCTAAANTGDGIRVTTSSLVVENNCSANTGAGVHVVSGSPNGSNRLEANNVTRNTTGILVDAAGNLILRNSAKANAANNYNIAIGNSFGPIVTTSPSTVAVTGNTAGSTLNHANGGTHPWANFSY